MSSEYDQNILSKISYTNDGKNYRRYIIRRSAS